MILPDLILPSRINQHWTYTGMDSLEHCSDKDYFKSYPHLITYDFNSRGFRDSEWPDSLNELQNSIWCIGDSFTVGVGSPLTHTWPWLLQKKTKIRTINVSLDGASNDWILRRAVDIINSVGPKFIIVQWSYLHRREKPIGEAQIDWWQKYYNQVKGPSWPNCEYPQDFFNLPESIQEELKTQHAPGPFYQVSDEERRLWHCNHVHTTTNEDIENLLQCVTIIENSCVNTKVIHSFIPKFANGNIEKSIVDQIKTLARNCLGPVEKIDIARDGNHYGIKSSENFVQQLVQFL